MTPATPQIPKALRDAIDDWHTHSPAKPRAIVNAPSPDSPFEPGILYSIGIHPWDANLANPETLRALEARAAADPQVVAIGEAGLDRLRGPELSEQQAIFEAQAGIAERVGKPLIIHAVRTIPEILATHKRLRPCQPWIIHGFRGRIDAVRQILARPGIYISIGAIPPPADALAAIPPERLLRETDMATTQGS